MNTSIFFLLKKKKKDFNPAHQPFFLILNPSTFFIYFELKKKKKGFKPRQDFFSPNVTKSPVAASYTKSTAAVRNLGRVSERREAMARYTGCPTTALTFSRARAAGEAPLGEGGGVSSGFLCWAFGRSFSLFLCFGLVFFVYFFLCFYFFF